VVITRVEQTKHKQPNGRHLWAQYERRDGGGDLKQQDDTQSDRELRQPDAHSHNDIIHCQLYAY